jgi:four helix bundle protein
MCAFWNMGRASSGSLKPCQKPWYVIELEISSSAAAWRWEQNYEEAQGAESRPDFNHKLQIALKELRESNYWLRLLEVAGKVPRDRLTDIIDESTQLRAILSKAVATAKANLK